jgi:hypothetical protein
MRTFWQGHIDGRNSRCQGAGGSVVTASRRLPGAGEASKACLISRSVRESRHCRDRLPGLLPLLAREAYTPDHRQAAAQSDDACDPTRPSTDALLRRHRPRAPHPDTPRAQRPQQGTHEILIPDGLADTASLPPPRDAGTMGGQLLGGKGNLPVIGFGRSGRSHPPASRHAARSGHGDPRDVPPARHP